MQHCCIEAIEQGLLALGARHFRRRPGGDAGGMLHRRAGEAVRRRIETREMIRGDALLFSESQSRIVVSLGRIIWSALQAARGAAQRARCRSIGSVGGTRLGRSSRCVQLPVEELRSAWATWIDGEAPIEQLSRVQGSRVRTSRNRPRELT